MNLSKFHRKLSKDDQTHFLIKIPVLTISSWLFQGILYMDSTERNFKIILDLILMLPIFLVLNTYLSNLSSLLYAIFIAHSVNWIFNGQIFVLLKNLRLTKTSANNFNVFLKEFKIKVENEKSISAAAAFGSLSRSKMSETSDLDIRIIRKSGIINGFKSCFFVLKERSKSFYNKFPLDIYVLDNSSMIPIHIKNEDPIIIYDPNNILKKMNCEESS